MASSSADIDNSRPDASPGLIEKSRADRTSKAGLRPTPVPTTPEGTQPDAQHLARQKVGHAYLVLVPIVHLSPQNDKSVHFASHRHAEPWCTEHIMQTSLMMVRACKSHRSLSQPLISMYISLAQHHLQHRYFIELERLASSTFTVALQKCAKLILTFK